MANNIVTVNVTQTVAPTPNTLQETGAFLSQGATNTAINTSTLLTQFSDLAPILTVAKAITTAAWATSVVTVTTAIAHGFTVSSTFAITISGMTPAAYNGTFTATVTGASTFTYPLVSNPGVQTVAGVYIPASVAELTAMATTFFAQGANAAVYVLELGAGSSAEGVVALGSYITANPNAYYAYLTPRPWGVESTFPAFLANFTGTTAKTYWQVTSTVGGYSIFGATLKNVLLLVEAPSIPATEFSSAARFYVTLNYGPSSTNKVTPLQYAYLVGVTAYPTKGNSSLFTSLKAASVDYVTTGAEGGISNTILALGVCKDGNPFNYWYSVDWAQINVDLDISNEIINGSNNPQAPLYYNQEGINRLQARAQSTMTRGVSYGLVLAPVSVTAVTFSAWVTANPSTYKVGSYGGLAVSYVPARGFSTITFNIQVSNFPLA